MNTATHPAASVAANVMRVEADLVLIGKIAAAFKATPPAVMTWATAADTARLAQMTRDVIDVFGSEVLR